MRVSLNLIKKYVDLPENITDDKIAYDMTLRTVEVEGIEKASEKYNNIVVGTILEVNYEEESYTVKFDEMDTPRQISYKIKLDFLQLFYFL